MTENAPDISHMLAPHSNVWHKTAPMRETTCRVSSRQISSHLGQGALEHGKCAQCLPESEWCSTRSPISSPAHRVDIAYGVLVAIIIVTPVVVVAYLAWASLTM